MGSVELGSQLLMGQLGDVSEGPKISVLLRQGGASSNLEESKEGKTVGILTAQLNDRAAVVERSSHSKEGEPAGSLRVRCEGPMVIGEGRERPLVKSGCVSVSNSEAGCMLRGRDVSTTGWEFYLYTRKEGSAKW